jgi:drug/metabolite transporter (DMT)-like permease
MDDKKKKNLLLVAAIILLYITWSSTYLAIRIAVRTISPLTMTAMRFIAAGFFMYIIAVLAGEKQPTKKELFGGAIVGIILFLVSNVMLCYAEENIGSGLSAVAVSSGAFWICLISGFFGKWPRKIEWLGIMIGFAGIVILATGGEMRGSIAATIILLLSSIAWAFGSVLSKNIAVPKNFMGNAVEMLAGGIGSLATIYATGGRLNFHPSTESLWALIYLITIGSMVGFSAFMYVFQNARAALASSYSYVNTIGAVILGVFVLNEKINGIELTAIAVVVSAVVIIVIAGGKSPKIRAIK